MNRRGALRVAGAVSCLLFTLSILYPFLQTEATRIDGPFHGYFGPDTFWSFKATYVVSIATTTNFQTVAEPWVVTERWFQDYWSAYITHKPVDRPSELGIGIAAVLILMFIAQASTFLSAALAIFKVKPYLFLSAAVLSLFTTLCMWLFSRALSVYRDLECTFQAGFWLTLPAAALFLVTFLIGQADSKLSPILFVHTLGAIE